MEREGTNPPSHQPSADEGIPSCYQPAESVAASAASLPSRSDRHRVATKRRPVIPSESGEASQRSGGTMIEGSSSADRILSGISSGIIPVRVAPPGKSAFTVTPVPARSCDQMMVYDSTAAYDGP
jgi:hypothetical protein